MNFRRNHMRKLYCLAVSAAILAAAAPARAAVWDQLPFAERCIAGQPRSTGGTLCSPLAMSAAVAALGYAAKPEARNPYAETIGLYSDLASAFAELREIDGRAMAYSANGMSRSFAIWNPLYPSVRPAAEMKFVNKVQDSFGGEVVGAMRREYANKFISTFSDGAFPEFIPEGEELSRRGFSLTYAIAFRPAFEVPFAAAATSNRVFRPANGAAREMRFVRGEREVAVAEVGALSAVALPLKGGLDLWLVRANGASSPAPSAISLADLEDIASSLRENRRRRNTVGDGDNSRRNIRNMERRAISFPVFSLESRTDLAEFFDAAKLPRDDFPDLGGPCSADYMRTAVKFTLDEGAPPPDGAVVEKETGAVPAPKGRKDAKPAGKRNDRSRTGPDGEPAAAPAAPAPEFACDSPFWFFVWQDNPGLVLFAGRFDGEP